MIALPCPRPSSIIRASKPPCHRRNSYVHVFNDCRFLTTPPPCYLLPPSSPTPQKTWRQCAVDAENEPEVKFIFEVVAEMALVPSPQMAIGVNVGLGRCLVATVLSLLSPGIAAAGNNHIEPGGLAKWAKGTIQGIDKSSAGNAVGTFIRSALQTILMVVAFFLDSVAGLFGGIPECTATVGVSLKVLGHAAFSVYGVEANAIKCPVGEIIKKAWGAHHHAHLHETEQYEESTDPSLVKGWAEWGGENGIAKTCGQVSVILAAVDIGTHVAVGGQISIKSVAYLIACLGKIIVWTLWKIGSAIVTGVRMVMGYLFSVSRKKQSRSGLCRTRQMMLLVVPTCLLISN